MENIRDISDVFAILRNERRELYDKDLKDWAMPTDNYCECNLGKGDAYAHNICHFCKIFMAMSSKNRPVIDVPLLNIIINPLRDNFALNSYFITIMLENRLPINIYSHFRRTKGLFSCGYQTYAIREIYEPSEINDVMMVFQYATVLKSLEKYNFVYPESSLNGIINTKDKRDKIILLYPELMSLTSDNIELKPNCPYSKNYKHRDDSSIICTKNYIFYTDANLFYHLRMNGNSFGNPGTFELYSFLISLKCYNKIISAEVKKLWSDIWKNDEEKINKLCEAYSGEKLMEKDICKMLTGIRLSNNITDVTLTTLIRERPVTPREEKKKHYKIEI